MATHFGKEGVIKIQNQTLAGVRSWTLNTAAELVDASCLGDSWKVHQPTLKSWHGSLACFWDDTDPIQNQLTVGEPINVILYPAGDPDQHASFSGTAFITARDYTGSHSGLIEANLTFQGTGALIYDKPIVKNTVSKKME